VIGERTSATVTAVVGERGGNELEGVGGVAEGGERAKNGKKGSKETAEVVVVGAECGEIGELGNEMGEPADSVGMMRGESLGRLNAGRSTPDPCLTFLPF